MTCQNLGSGVTVCGPPPGVRHQLRVECWTCEEVTDQVETWDGAWYGTTRSCLACGDIWSDGCRYQRPFKRYWKRERLARAKALWDSCISEEEWSAYTLADVRLACAKSEVEQEVAAADRHASLLRIRGVAS